MLDQEVYTKKMAATPLENMSVNNDWTIAFNGNHRALALKIMGTKRVKESGMNEWIKITHI